MLVVEKKHHMIQKKVKSKKNWTFVNNQNGNIIKLSGNFPDTLEEMLEEALKQVLNHEYVVEDDDESYVDPKDFEWFKEATEELNNGKIISDLRYQFSLSQSDLGKKLGVTRKYVGDLENGRRRISIKMAKKLGEVFNHDPKDFIHFGEE